MFEFEQECVWNVIAAHSISANPDLDETTNQPETRSGAWAVLKGAMTQAMAVVSSATQRYNTTSGSSVVDDSEDTFVLTKGAERFLDEPLFGRCISDGGGVLNSRFRGEALLSNSIRRWVSADIELLGETSSPHVHAQPLPLVDAFQHNLTQQTPNQILVSSQPQCSWSSN